jgi:hypothetical protein
MFQVIGGAAGAAAGAVAGAAASSIGSGSARFRVDPDQVFALAKRFDQIAADIDDASSRGAKYLVARAPGADQPSIDAADRLIETAFGDAGLVTRTRAYAEELRKAAQALRDTATQYGLTDDTESARFGAAEI